MNTTSNTMLLDSIPPATSVLEIGCHDGSFGARYLSRNPSARYDGVEAGQTAAAKAATVLHHVVQGRIAQPGVIDAIRRAIGAERYNVLIFQTSFKFKHDSAAINSRLKELVQPNGYGIFYINNIFSQPSIQTYLLNKSIRDNPAAIQVLRRQYTVFETVARMLKNNGWNILDAFRHTVNAKDSTEAFTTLAAVLAQLGFPEKALAERLSTKGWIIRAENGSGATKFFIAAKCLSKIGGVTEARMDYPLRALAAFPGVAIALDHSEQLLARPEQQPGILILHRQIMHGYDPHGQIESLIARGWTVVLDIDDAPPQDPERAASFAYTFRAVHAVTVSTEPLQSLISTYNPFVRVFPNQIFALPDVANGVPKDGQRLRIFFGALHREADWEPIMRGIGEAALALQDDVVFIVVHDRLFYDNLPEGVPKHFLPTLNVGDYTSVLASSDIALLPLNDTYFNRMKSDLKCLECCAAGVVPICSPVVYGALADTGIPLYAETPEDWKQRLLSLCRDPEEISRRKKIGRDYVRRNRMHYDHAKPRLDYYQWLMSNRTMLEKERRKRLSLASPDV